MQYNESMLKFFSVIHRRAMMYLDKELVSFNIRAGQVPILRILAEEDGITQEKIKRLLHMDKGALAKTIKPLITHGYIVREQAKDDGRAYAISLTPKGREVMPQISTIIANWIDTVTLGMTKKEQNNAHNLLAKMSQNAFKHFEKTS